MDRFSKAWLLLIVILLSVIAFRPALSPTIAHAAAIQYTWLRSAGITDSIMDHDSDRLNQLAAKGCEVVSTLPLDAISISAGVAGGSFGGGGTHNLVYILKCPK